jgi:hypothetical protein
MPAADLDVLRRDLAASRRVQRRLRWILAAGAALAIVLLAAGSTGALAVATVTAIVVGAGFWITQGHIAEFERGLRAIRPPAGSGPSASTASPDPSPRRGS